MGHEDQSSRPRINHRGGERGEGDELICLTRPSKYRAQACEIDGLRFASKKEGARYRALQLLAKARLIQSLELQVKYTITIGAHKICSYIADFRYLNLETGHYVVEDVKGFKTPMYRLKKKLVKACYGIDIVEV